MVMNEKRIMYSKFGFMLGPGRMFCYNTGMVFRVPHGHVLKFHPGLLGMQIGICFKNLIGGVDICADNTIGFDNERIIGICITMNTLDIVDFSPGNLLAKAELIRTVNNMDVSMVARIDIYERITSS